MKDKDQLQRIFIISVIVVLVLVLILAFVFRYTLFKTGKYLTKLPESELISKGYGTYANVFETGCLTADGKCSTSGVKYVTQYCVPHPTTGNGCLTQEGEMTFASQNIVQNCLPNCRKYILNDVSDTSTYATTSGLCRYSPTYNPPTVPCIPLNAQAYQYSIFTCNINDKVGDNACTYVCGSDGITDNGISGDSDSTLPSFIPSCVGRKGDVITLNSFPWGLVGSLPDQGVVISKGYTIKNYVDTNGNIDLNLFNVTPPYLPPAKSTNPLPFPTSVITKDELVDLDNTFVVYENCTPSVPKPYCKSLGLFKPKTIEATTTLIESYFPPITPQNFAPTKACYVSPFWNSPATPPFLSNFTNPYNAVIDKYNMLSGIGQLGITYEYQTCGPTGPLEKVPLTDPVEYFMPPAYSPQNSCAPLTAGITGPSSTSCYIDKNYIPTTLITGQTYNICDTVFPDGSHPLGYNGSTPAPGLVVPCEYLPSNSDIDFSGTTTGGIVLEPEIQEWIGNYIQIYATYGSSPDKYFLGLLTTPCASGTSSDNLLPLSNCSTIAPYKGTGYQSLKCCFVYNGGSDTSVSAGNYWGKTNCDGEMIELTSALNIIVSPRSVLNAVSITCDLYATSGNTFGQLIALPNGSYFDLYFQPLTDAERQNPSNYNTNPFKLKYNASTSQIEITVNGFGLPIFVASYNGDPISGIPTMNISGYSGVVLPTTIYQRALPFEGPILKAGGIYSGQDVQLPVGLQRSSSCYYSSCDPNVANPNNPCFPKTCNLYYEYNPELC